MAIEKVNFHYPKKNLQSVYSHEEMSALELAAATAGKVDECIEMVNGVEQSAIEARQIVDVMRNAQDNFILENDDIRAQLILDNQEFIETLETSKVTFENEMTTTIETITDNAETLIQNDVNTKIDTLIGDGTIETLINDTIIGGVNGRITNAELAFEEVTGRGVISGLNVLQQSNPDMTVLISAGVSHLYNGKRYTLLENATTTIDAPDLYPRIDIIFINSGGILTYGKGVASASPIAPTPVNGILLAEIFVDVSTTTITSSSITDKRTFKTLLPNLKEDFEDLKTPVELNETI